VIHSYNWSTVVNSPHLLLICSWMILLCVSSLLFLLVFISLRICSSFNFNCLFAATQTPSKSAWIVSPNRLLENPQWIWGCWWDRDSVSWYLPAHVGVPVAMYLSELHPFQPDVVLSTVSSLLGIMIKLIWEASRRNWERSEETLVQMSGLSLTTWSSYIRFMLATMASWCSQEEI